MEKNITETVKTAKKKKSLYGDDKTEPNIFKTQKAALKNAQNIILEVTISFK